MSENRSRVAPEVEVDPGGSRAPTLRATSTLGHAVAEHEQQMVRKGFSENTIKSFGSDLRILLKFMGSSAILREIQTQHLEDFLVWMQSERGRPCSAKTLARRITTLKVFFAWLHGVGTIGTDPAEPLIQYSVKTPMPVVLNNNEVNKLVRVSQDWLWDRDKSDARPYVLVNLLLQTSIKKSETVKILIEDIERGNPLQPEVKIRYAEERYAHKNRSLGLHSSFLSPLDQYLAQYRPESFLFECTARNLEYVLEEVGKKAGIRRLQVGFETLRWTGAVRDFRQGMKEEQLRLKMGLSSVAWRDTGLKIQQLAGN